MIGWEKDLAFSIVTRAFDDLLNDSQLKLPRDEAERLDAQTSAREWFLSSDEGNGYWRQLWCGHANLDPGLMSEAARRLENASAEERKLARADLAYVLFRSRIRESDDGDPYGSESSRDDMVEDF